MIEIKDFYKEIDPANDTSLSFQIQENSENLSIRSLATADRDWLLLWISEPLGSPAEQSMHLSRQPWKCIPQDPGKMRKEEINASFLPSQKEHPWGDPLLSSLFHYPLFLQCSAFTGSCTCHESALLLTYVPRASHLFFHPFPSLTLLSSLSVSLESASKVQDMYWNPCLLVCFWETPN